MPTAYRPAAAQINTTATASLAEDTDMSGVLKAIFDATGMTGSYYLFAGSTLRTAFTTMTRMKANAVNSATKIRNLQGEIEDSTISSTTSIFRGDYGNIEVLSSSWISWASSAPQLGDGLLLDMDKIHLRTAEHPDIHPLEDKGGGPRFYIDTQCGLQVDNPLGLAKFTP